MNDLLFPIASQDGGFSLGSLASAHSKRWRPREGAGTGKSSRGQGTRKKIDDKGRGPVRHPRRPRPVRGISNKKHTTCPFRDKGRESKMIQLPAMVRTYHDQLWFLSKNGDCNTNDE